MDTAADKRRERHLRKWALGMGLAVRKSRARDPHRMDYGRYRIENVETDYVVAGRFPYGYTLDLDAVAEVLEELELNREEEEFKRGGLPGDDSVGGFDPKYTK
ncbi:MAG: hypothetical protein JXA87_01995 [Thermoleophilia bacterium]|nr:hypothetical protein [Thermoleophilia bacterium]